MTIRLLTLYYIPHQKMKLLNEKQASFNPNIRVSERRNWIRFILDPAPTVTTLIKYRRNTVILGYKVNSELTSKMRL